MLNAELQTQLAAYLSRLTHPIEIVATLDQSATALEIRALLKNVATASTHVRVSEALDSQALNPSFALRPVGGEARIRFAGIPLGHEFTSLVLALLQVGGYPPKIDAPTRLKIEALEGDYVFETFVSLSCHNCPDVVQALNLMAVINPRIRHTMIEGSAFTAEVERRQILSLPCVYLNGKPWATGRMTLDDLLTKLAPQPREARTENLSSRAPYDVLVVGGGPAGAAAAVYAARKGLRTGVAAERFGGQVLDTAGIENFISLTNARARISVSPRATR